MSGKDDLLKGRNEDKDGDLFCDRCEFKWCLRRRKRDPKAGLSRCDMGS